MDLLVRVKPDGTRNNIDQRAEGECTQELRVDPAILKAIEHSPCPMVCEVETERHSNGRESKEVVIASRRAGRRALRTAPR